MTTHIIFWNPDISSYTKERFLDDYNEKESVGNWSFYGGSGVIPWQSYPKMIDKRYMKNGRSDTPCS